MGDHRMDAVVDIEGLHKQLQAAKGAGHAVVVQVSGESTCVWGRCVWRAGVLRWHDARCTMRNHALPMLGGGTPRHRV